MPGSGCRFGRRIGLHRVFRCRKRGLAHLPQQTFCLRLLARKPPQMYPGHAGRGQQRRKQQPEQRPIRPSHALPHPAAPCPLLPVLIHFYCTRQSGARQWQFPGKSRFCLPAAARFSAARFSAARFSAARFSAVRFSAARSFFACFLPPHARARQKRRLCPGARPCYSFRCSNRTLPSCTIAMP